MTVELFIKCSLPKEEWSFVEYEAKPRQWPSPSTQINYVPSQKLNMNVKE